MCLSAHAERDLGDLCWERTADVGSRGEASGDDREVEGSNSLPWVSFRSLKSSK